MKKILLIFSLSILSFNGFSQAVPQSLVFLSTLTDLRAQVPQINEVVTLMGLSSITDGNGGEYSWNNTSTATDDGFLTIAVTGVTTGRWLRIGNGNTIKGSLTASGISLTSSYTVNYQGNVTLPFTPITAIIIPRSLAAAGPSYVSSITTTGFTVNFVLAPTIGTNNLSFDYIVIKQ